ncbi:MAG: hypothetical protein A3H72_00140 [Candidatus Doudnabacteria bacterium RIFCSPLOWO2_02_FULL_48_8]|uniref:Cell division protein FtsX n=1 Tax=Candidatus Doudnabacteria bacterium RIFCSPHIGHO2_01_FULL_46_24 TaxID=1817825 RepID=A0A1F5NU21_9BACT|nr:MAG: hypothetical protein A2720_01060 [Candidatus Doudnabacteria bacterium RIFCSPHIGHO2_01_FULL_46_24]OGE95482.1 MAG: hypothetical protein A3E98_01145 [Candidatus Doudnabacteria bacterium RIFCSPHIGHO2_12_FULL_48_11]OGE95570.1 MAG: hypothetical protein A3H72_00140 [Candidatus Doudnabacteria bacterium RIFCSPLOWO2_02_FULL_48_8]
MNFSTFNRLIRSGSTNFLRNLGVSLSATAIMVVTLFIISTVLVLYALTDLSLNNARDRVGISVYFSDSASTEEIGSAREQIQAYPGVRSITFTSKEQARDRYIERNKNRPRALEALKELDRDTDPFPNSLAITADEFSNYESIVNYIKSDRFKSYLLEDGVRDNRKIIDRLSRLTDVVRQLGIALTVVFIAVTIMVMFNTIRLTIYNRREEVEIMRLVGATNWYIRMPFIIESIIYALLATFITSLAMLLLLSLTSSRIETFLDLKNLGGNLIRGIFPYLVVINLFTGIALGVIASTIAMRRYLKI